MTLGNTTMNKLPDIIYAIAALCSVIASILAWVAKIRWSKEFGEAKDATIRAKEAEVTTKDAHIASLKSEIEGLKHLTPMKIKEYFDSVTAQLSEYNDSLLKQLSAANDEIQKMDASITTLQAQGSHQTSKIQELEKEKEEIQKAKEALQQKAQTLSKQAGWQFPISSIDPRFLQSIADSSKRLSDTFGKGYEDYSTRVAEISARLQDSIVTFPSGFSITPSGYIAPLPATPKKKPMQNVKENDEGKKSS
jgi:uncharacterized phage infection (PIP) family protein YhgE